MLCLFIFSRTVLEDLTYCKMLSDPAGPVDKWLQHMVIPPLDENAPIHVALVALFVGPLPPWLDYTARSMSFAADQGE